MTRAAAVVAAGATGWVLVRGPSSARGFDVVLLVVGFVALAVLIGGELRRPRLSRGLVWGLTAPLLVLAVVIPPTESHDVWAYAMYGRIVSHYHSNPYKRQPYAFWPEDRWARRMDSVWRHTESVYGPLFTGISAVGMAVFGHTFLGARLFFQILAALALLAVMLAIDRRTRSPAALALLGLNPIVVISVVNGAHNDILVGLGVLAGVLLVTRQRPVWAGVALALAALVKISALLPLAAIALWVWRRHGFKAAAALSAAAAAIVLVGLGVAGGRAVLAPLETAQHNFTSASVWYGPRRWLTAHELGAGLSGSDALDVARTVISLIASVAAMGLTLLLVGRRLRTSDPALVAGAAVLAYMLLAAYVLPWYVAWGLPALALAWRSRLTWLAVLHAAILHVVYVPDPSLQGHVDKLHILSPIQRLMLDVYQVWTPLLEVVVVVSVVVISLRRPKWSLANVPVSARSQTTLADSTTPAPSSRRQPTRT